MMGTVEAQRVDGGFLDGADALPTLKTLAGEAQIQTQRPLLRVHLNVM